MLAFCDLCVCECPQTIHALQNEHPYLLQPLPWSISKSGFNEKPQCKQEYDLLKELKASVLFSKHEHPRKKNTHTQKLFVLYDFGNIVKCYLGAQYMTYTQRKKKAKQSKEKMAENAVSTLKLSIGKHLHRLLLPRPTTLESLHKIAEKIAKIPTGASFCFFTQGLSLYFSLNFEESNKEKHFPLSFLSPQKRDFSLSLSFEPLPFIYSFPSPHLSFQSQKIVPF